MNGSFEVKKNGQVIGTAELRQQGLYCHVRCRCCLEGTGMQRLSLGVGKRVIDLGILVPMSGEFGMDTRIAAKRIPEGTPEFWVGERVRREAPPEETAREAPAAEMQPEPEEPAEAPMPAEQPAEAREAPMPASPGAENCGCPTDGPEQTPPHAADETAGENTAAEASAADAAALPEPPALEKAAAEDPAQAIPAALPGAEEMPVSAPKEEVPPEAAMVFHPVAEDAPFDQLSRLPEAVLATEGEQMGVVLPEE